MSGEDALVNVSRLLLAQDPTVSTHTLTIEFTPDLTGTLTLTVTVKARLHVYLNPVFTPSLTLTLIRVHCR